MPQYQMQNFPIRVDTPLGEDAILFEHMTCSERISEPYTFELTVLSPKQDLKADALLGQSVTVSIEQPAGGKRPFNGYVSRMVSLGEKVLVGAAGSPRQLHRYRLRLQPWFWFLTRASDCRIFQHKSVKDIFGEVAKGHGFNDFEFKLDGSYKDREYCVQYRESDFNFLSRLLEESGIRYFFRHEARKHVMVLTDESSHHECAPHYDKVPYRPTAGSRSSLDRVESWWVEHEVQAGAFATTDFDFENPKTSLLKKSVHSRQHARSSFEMFDFPATPEVMDGSNTELVAKRRLEELQSAHERFRGASSHCLGMVTGAKFGLVDHPREDFKRDYIVIGTEHTIAGNQYASGEGEPFSIGVSVEAIDAKTPFRPARVTPKPVIYGAQTAMVVGQNGQEIDTDKYGRVKVQFPWDRHGESDEKSSCWVRVAQIWAGKNWGAIHIPRIGQEVLVSFLEGDPDRPIVSGRVYNAECTPPYSLPDNASQSGIKSRSTKEGSAENYNEIRFEDKKDEEELYVQAEKNMTLDVKNKRKTTIGKKKKDENEEPTDDLTVKGNRTSEIEKDDQLTVKGKRTGKIDKDDELTVKGKRTSTIEQDDELTVKGKRSSTIQQDDTLKVNASSTTTVQGKYSLESVQEIELKTGASKLVMKADGTIQITGVKIEIQAANSITQSGAAKIELSAAEFSAKGGAMAEVKAGGICTVKGGVTMIG